MTIAELKARKRELGYSNKMVSDISGIPVSTLQKIFGGSTEAPRYETLCKLEKALFPDERELRKYDPYYMPDSDSYRMYVNEPHEAYSCGTFLGYYEEYEALGKQQGRYTVSDYLALPSDIRMELIDGILYDMAAPDPIHQMITGEVYAQLSAALFSSDGECVPFISPVDVQFEDSMDAVDMVQPDLAIVCDKSKLFNEKGRIIGAPDMVMEVLSPSTRGKDRVAKLNKYGQKGVKEYWIVDPDNSEILVYYYQNGFGPIRYTFEDRIPISIFDGRLSVNFAVIKRRLERALGFGTGPQSAAGNDGSDGSPAA